MSAFFAALLLVGGVWPLICVRGLSATLSFERHRGLEGEPVEAVVTLRNRYPWTVQGLLLSGLDAGGGFVALPAARWFSTTTVTFRFVPERRGVYPAEAPTVSTRLPLGLATGSVPLECSTPLLAWPRDTEAPPLDRRGSTPSVFGAPTPRGGGDGDFVGLRAYRQGDSARRIHWRHSARRGELVVRDGEAKGRTEIAVALDLASFTGSSTETRDEALRVVATLLREAMGYGWAVRCRLRDRELPISTRKQARALLDRLARFEFGERSYPLPRGPWIVIRAADVEPQLRRATAPQQAVLA